MYHIYAKRHNIVHFALGFSISKTRPFQVFHSLPNARFEALPNARFEAFKFS